MSDRHAEHGAPRPARITSLMHAGRGIRTEGLVAPPVERASTLLAADVESYETAHPYGTGGTAPAHALAAALLEMEGGEACFLYPTGLAAIAGTILALARAGDHVLVTDAVYYPTRRLLDGLLAGFGVSVTYFDPRAPVADILARIGPATTLLFLESPASDSMEVLDVPALTAGARKAGVVTVIDNTWSAGWLFDPFAAGCDVSIQALTKYQNGHSDVLAGAVLTRGETSDRIAAAHRMLGQILAPDDAWQVLRGLRTLPVRLERHGASALRVAEWLSGRREVEIVLHPALPSCHGHEIWKRDFRGSSGLFSFVLDPRYGDEAVRAFIDGLRLFGIGASWGGYESLVLRKDMRRLRTTPWPHEGWLVRLSIGLEDPDDLIADLAAGFDRMRSVTGG